MRTVRLVKGGTIVTAGETYEADVVISDGKIAAIGAGLGADAAVSADETIDARGMYVIPGGIDPHTHLDTVFGGALTVDDYETGTIAAAAGGTTCVIDFAMQEPGQRLTEAADNWLEKAMGRSVFDWSVHMMVGEADGQALEDMAALVDRGITSFKVFLAYKGAVMIDDAVLYRTLKRAKELGALVMAHCENGDVLDEEIKAALAAGGTAPKYHAYTRPEAAEAEATYRFLALAELVGVPAYVVHLTCAPALEEVQRAINRGQAVWAETCPQYLFTSLEDIEKDGFEGAKYVFSPPVRHRRNWEPLWRGLATGALSTVGSDHCPFDLEGGKALGRDDFSLIPNGGPGIEDRMVLMYHYGVKEGRITLNQWVDMCSTRIAKIFGLFPRKGAIAVGADADIVVWDPDSERTISAATHRQNVDYNLYEGFRVTGEARHVMVRGRMVFDEGEFVGEPGYGRFLPRARISGRV